MLIVGLGNPGKKYEHTRHNVGFMAVDFFAQKNGLNFELKKIFHSEMTTQDDLVIAKPQTFMNDSGQAVKALVKQYGESLVVAYDDVYIPIGQVKCSFGRGSGDHNGLQSVIDHIGHKDFFRIRIGVRPIHEELLPRIAPPDGFEKFLLDDFTDMEEDLLRQGIARAVEIIEALKTKNFQEVMNQFN